jgi:predicted negative regulator of RcsB-dependent stress response
MTRTGEAARPSLEDPSENFFEWLQTHTREVSLAALAIFAVALGAWLYGYFGRSKTAKAEGLLAQAETTLSAQRLPEAQAQLERLVQSYQGTPAAGQGLLRLAQVLYEQGKFQDGVARLEGAFGEHDSGPFAVSVRQLAAAGYEQLGQPADAAARYAEAAAKSTLAGERDGLNARAARAWADAGQKGEAVRIWKAILERPESPLANEARIRIGELTAVPASATAG